MAGRGNDTGVRPDAADLSEAWSAAELAGVSASILCRSTLSSCAMCGNRVPRFLVLGRNVRFPNYLYASGLYFQAGNVISGSEKLTAKNLPLACN